MALIKCSECSAEISDKASCCPKCGAHITSEFDNIDIYSFSAPQSDKTEIANKNQNVDKTPSFVKKNKRHLRLLFIICFIAMFAIVVIGLIQNKGKSPDPNRTTEKCSLYGTTRVFGIEHQMNTTCIKDGDGWYHPTFGHHHHK